MLHPLFNENSTAKDFDFKMFALRIAGSIITALIAQAVVKRINEFTAEKGKK